MHTATVKRLVREEITRLGRPLNRGDVDRVLERLKESGHYDDETLRRIHQDLETMLEEEPPAPTYDTN